MLWISFDSGIVRPLVIEPAWPADQQLIDRCTQIYQQAKLLNDKLQTISECKFNGREYVIVEQ